MRGSAAKGLLIGLGVAVAVGMLAPIVVRVSRPLGRAAAKTGMVVYQKGRETVAELGEVLEDLVEEARAELEVSREDVIVGEDAEDLEVEQAAADPESSAQAAGGDPSRRTAS